MPTFSEESLLVVVVVVGVVFFLAALRKCQATFLPNWQALANWPQEGATRTCVEFLLSRKCKCIDFPKHQHQTSVNRNYPLPIDLLRIVAGKLKLIRIKWEFGKFLNYNSSNFNSIWIQNLLVQLFMSKKLWAKFVEKNNLPKVNFLSGINRRILTTSKQILHKAERRNFSLIFFEIKYRETIEDVWKT